MTAEELLKAGKLEEALKALQEQVRANAADPKLRVFLFQLLSVLGQWDRSLNQLGVLSNMDSDSMMLSRIFEPVVRCEQLRAEIFAGKRTPIVFGEPEPWMSRLIQANGLLAAGETVAAAKLRDEAFEQASSSPGMINGQPFEWIADADPRLGPMLEAVIEGHYYWIPFNRIQKMLLEPPTDLRDLVWMPVQFVWSNGGEASGHVPTRYPGTERSVENELRLARKTSWTDLGENYVTGTGQRVIATDAGEFALLECRLVELTSVGPTSAEVAAESGT